MSILSVELFCKRSSTELQQNCRVKIYVREIGKNCRSSPTKGKEFASDGFCCGSVVTGCPCHGWTTITAHRTSQNLSCIATKPVEHRSCLHCGCVPEPSFLLLHVAPHAINFAEVPMNNTGIAQLRIGCSKIGADWTFCVCGRQRWGVISMGLTRFGQRFQYSDISIRIWNANHG